MRNYLSNALDWVETSSFSRIAINFNTCILSFNLGVCSPLVFHNLVELPGLLIATLVVALLASKRIVFLPLLMLVLGFFWATWCFSQHFENRLPAESEKVSIKVTGRIQGLPENNETSSSFDFLITHAYSNSGESILPLKNQLVKLSCYHCDLKFLPDQNWNLTVRLKRPHSYASWGAFDYEKYLFRHRIIATGYVRVKEANNLFSQSSSLSINQWRWNLATSLDQTLQENRVGQAIIAALMIGDKSRFSYQQQLVFQKSGLSHLMAISGLHIGLAFLVTVYLLNWCFAPIAYIYQWIPRQRLVLIPALASAFFYAGLAGFAISTQRALIMLSLFVLARLLARELSLLKVLMITVSLIFIYDPFSILDVGFWLSCSAVLVIALIVESRNLKFNAKKGSDDPQAVKLSLFKLQPLLWIGMLPVTLLFFGKISIVSPFINLIMVPVFCGLLIPITLLCLVLQLVGAQLISHYLLNILAYVYEKIYELLVLLTDFPLAQLSLPPMSGFDWLLFAILIGSYYFTLRGRHFVLILFVLMITLSSPKKFATDEFNATLLDVGQGLAMVIEVRDFVLVYDTGPAYPSGFNTASAVLLPFLQHRGIQNVDMLIISHADNDHIGGLSSLLNSMPVNQILTSRVDKIPEASLCRQGQKWSVADIDFNIVSPDDDTPLGSNNRSCVLMVANSQKKLLITGDIEKQVERHILNKQLDISANIMLVPHQGSKTSSTAEFVAAVGPSLALVAAGYKNHYGHPHGDVISRYRLNEIDVFSTIESGSITLNIKGNDVMVDRYRESHKGFWQHVKKPT